MDNKVPKLGKKGAIKEIAKKLTELRKKPLSKKIHDIVRENYERNENLKKAANPKIDKDL